MVTYILLFMLWLMLLLFFFMWRAMKQSEYEMQQFYKEMREMPYKFEPVKEAEEVEHELQAENEVNNEVYDKIMEEWMGITMDVKEGEDGK